MEDQPGPTAPAVGGQPGAQPDAKTHAPNDLSLTAEQAPAQPLVELAPIADVSPTAALVVTPVIRQLQEVPATQPASQQAATPPQQAGAVAGPTQVPTGEVAPAGCGTHTQPEAATSAGAVASDTPATETHSCASLSTADPPVEPNTSTALPPSEEADMTLSAPLTPFVTATESNTSVPSQQLANPLPLTAPTAPAPATAPPPPVKQPRLALQQQTNSAVKAHASHLRALAQLGVVPAAAGVATAATAAPISAADAAAAAAADRRSARQRHKKTQDEELANAASALMQVWGPTASSRVAQTSICKELGGPVPVNNTPFRQGSVRHAHGLRHAHGIRQAHGIRPHAACSQVAMPDRYGMAEGAEGSAPLRQEPGQEAARARGRNQGRNYGSGSYSQEGGGMSEMLRRAEEDGDYDVGVVLVRPILDETFTGQLLSLPTEVQSNAIMSNNNISIPLSLFGTCVDERHLPDLAHLYVKLENSYVLEIGYYKINCSANGPRGKAVDQAPFRASQSSGGPPNSSTRMKMTVGSSGTICKKFPEPCHVVGWSTVQGADFEESRRRGRPSIAHLMLHLSIPPGKALSGDVADAVDNSIAPDVALEAAAQADAILYGEAMMDMDFETAAGRPSLPPLHNHTEQRSHHHQSATPSAHTAHRKRPSSSQPHPPHLPQQSLADQGDGEDGCDFFAQQQQQQLQAPARSAKRCRTPAGPRQRSKPTSNGGGGSGKQPLQHLWRPVDDLHNGADAHQVKATPDQLRRMLDAASLLQAAADASAGSAAHRPSSPEPRLGASPKMEDDLLPFPSTTSKRSSASRPRPTSLTTTAPGFGSIRGGNSPVDRLNAGRAVAASPPTHPGSGTHVSLQLPSSATAAATAAAAAAAASGLSQGLPVLPDLENINGLAPLVKQFLNAFQSLQTPAQTKALFLKVVQKPSSRETLDLMYVFLQDACSCGDRAAAARVIAEMTEDMAKAASLI
ncbi:MAG: hypothetical protein WDW36_005827 [Sanguina aurantia]